MAMKTKVMSRILLTLVVASMLFSIIPVMAAPINAVDKNPNLVQSNNKWIKLTNGDVPKNAWNIGAQAGRHIVYVDTTKMGANAIAVKFAMGWVWSPGQGGGDTYLYKNVQPAD